MLVKVFSVADISPDLNSFSPPAVMSERHLSARCWYSCDAAMHNMCSTSKQRLTSNNSTNAMLATAISSCQLANIMN
jgi:hypothetical protein